MTLDEIWKALEQCSYEIMTEDRLARVGLKDKQEIAPIIKKYAWLHELSTVEFVRAAWLETKDEELRRLFFELAGGYVYAQICEEADEVATFFAQSVVEVEGQKIPFHTISSQIVNEPDFEKRERLQDASYAVVEKMNPKLLLMTERDVTLRKSLGFEYLAYYESQKQIDYGRFSLLVTDLHGKLKDLYRALMTGYVKKLGRPFGELRSCHAAYLLKMGHLDAYFPKEKLVESFRRTVKGLGLDEAAQARIQIDDEIRPKKQPRAACYPAKAPDEVHLIIAPVGGRSDYRAFFHEGGHAEHFAHFDPGLSYADRHLSSSHALTELFSYTFEALTWSPAWLEEVMGLAPDVAVQVSHECLLDDLFKVELYLGKFSFEYQMYQDGLLKTGGELYTKTLQEFSGFKYGSVMYLQATDGGFYSADYLRAWIARAQVQAYLEREFGSRWFADPRAGEWLKSIWRDGSRHELEWHLESRGVGRGMDVSALVERFKRALVKQ